MEITVSYSGQQLEAAVKFIARNNSHFLGETDYIRSYIINHMRQIAARPNEYLSATMGYTLWGERIFEGIDEDENTIYFDILVDPALGMDYDGAQHVQEILETNP